MMTQYSLMRLPRVPEPFDHPDFLYELKHDGFRAIAVRRRGDCRLVSRNGYTFKAWPRLCDEIECAVSSAVLDGEVFLMAALENSQPSV